MRILKCFFKVIVNSGYVHFCFIEVVRNLLMLEALQIP